MILRLWALAIRANAGLPWALAKPAFATEAEAMAACVEWRTSGHRGDARARVVELAEAIPRTLLPVLTKDGVVIGGIEYPRTPAGYIIPHSGCMDWLCGLLKEQATERATAIAAEEATP